MSHKRKTINSALAFTAFLSIQGELLEATKSTPLYRQVGKNLINRMIEYVEEEENKAVKHGFYDNDVIEKQLQGFQRAGEQIVRILQTSDNDKLQDFLDMLEAFDKGQYKIKDNEEKDSV